MDKTVDTLVLGETLLMAVKAVSGGKLQLEFAEIIRSPYASASNPLVAAFNASDPRFSTRARRAWQSGEKADIERLLGIELGDMEKGDVKELNILNPKVNGVALKIQITETTTPDDYQKENIKDTAKRAGSEGDFIMYGGKHIFSNTSIVQGDVEHTFLKPDPAPEVPESKSSEKEVEKKADELTA